MKVVFDFPHGTVFAPLMDQYYLFSAYAGEARVALIDSRLCTWVVVPDEPEPTPAPTPTPPETELYKVVTTFRLNVRVDHTLTAEIKARLQPGEEFPLEVGATFEDEDNDILWRKVYPNGWWVAVSREGVVYAEKVDTSSRAG